MGKLIDEIEECEKMQEEIDKKVNERRAELIIKFLGFSLLEPSKRVDDMKKIMINAK